MIKYVHTNIIAKDWEKIANFYTQVFGCEIVPPIRNISENWLAEATGVENAQLKGCHLRLPGFGADSPTLEIYSYSETESQNFLPANVQGFRHIAFLTDDVESLTEEVIKFGGKKIGNIVRNKVEGVGILTFIYVADPEGNIIEIQSWDKF